MMSLLTMVGSKIPHRLFDPWTPCLQQLLKVTTPPSHHGHRRFPLCWWMVKQVLTARQLQLGLLPAV
jgi:hypothetical protein